MRFLATILAIGVLSGCVTTAPQLKKSKDPYSSKANYKFGPIKTKNCPDRNPVNGFVDVRFVGADDLHVMSVNYSGDGWIFLSTVRPMDLLIDGKSTQLKPINSPSRDAIGGRRVSETVFYPVTKDVVRQLASARSVQFRILGNKGSLEQCVSAEALKTIEEVIPLVP